MKRLSRQERLGAIVLAIVSIMVAGGSIWLRSCSSASSASDITINILENGSRDSVSGHDAGSHNRATSKKLKSSGSNVKDVAKTKGKRKNGGKPTLGKEKNNKVERRRDFLNEHIPVKSNKVETE